jgi:hypothetical protein
MCPSGKVALPEASGPACTAATRISPGRRGHRQVYGWSVVAKEMAPTDQEWELTAFAICVAAS